MAAEFQASPGQLREEFGQLAGAGIVGSEKVGRQVYYRPTKSTRFSRGRLDKNANHVFAVCAFINLVMAKKRY